LHMQESSQSTTQWDCCWRSVLLPYHLTCMFLYWCCCTPVTNTRDSNVEKCNNKWYASMISIAIDLSNWYSTVPYRTG
jgi:hypothetical protein